MPRFRSLRALPLLPWFALSIPTAAGARAQTAPVASASIEVTATRVAEATDSVPAMVTVLSGDELRQRGVTDLPGALALVGGLSLSPGSGDAGPAGAVPELYGLREADAYLLVVDGVPWGGTFNPSLVTLDLHDVDRIEVLRGAAPVMYGATSFVGVIQVIHRAAGSSVHEASVYAGSYQTRGAAVGANLPAIAGWQQSLSVNFDRQGFRDPATDWRRGHVLYRGASAAGAGRFHLDVDGTVLRQDPASPVPNDGAIFPAATVPLDRNQNPTDARVDEDRLHLVTGYDRSLAGGEWSTTLAFTRATRRNTRGFLNGPDPNQDPIASGFRQHLWETDAYFDSHLGWKPAESLQLVVGIDHLYGSGAVDSFNFDFPVGLDGSNRPSTGDVPTQELNVTHDRRNFSGLYAQAEWWALPRLRLELGGRLNHTDEVRHAVNHPLASGADPLPTVDENRKVTRGGAIAGLSFLAWSNPQDSLWLFADYRNTYKPAATDFGPEVEHILRPETAQSWEAGAKGNLDRGRLTWEVAAFTLDFQNVVVPIAVAGLPGTANAHEQRLRGIEAEATYQVIGDLRWQASYAHHDARYRDFVQLFNGEPLQLAGNRVEMSARDLAATGLTWAPPEGPRAWVTVNRVGSRFLDRLNTALAPAYATWSAGVGYKLASWELDVDGTNLNNTRPPVAASEFGGGSYYVMPARALRARATVRF